ncbi:MAG: hypothetical protein LBR47_01640 [Spirochaetaceae bacterium]|jgi:hypothetical protein|nr:hypothetical protein [Spirochaetaceae bacterium]
MKIATKTKIVIAGALALTLSLFVSCATTDSASKTDAAPSAAEGTAGTRYTLNASNLAAGDFADGTKVGDNNYFTLNVPNSAESKLSVDGNNKTVKGVSYTQRLKLGGVVNTLSFTMASAGTVNIVCQSSSGSADRKLLFLSGGNEVTSVPSPGSAPAYSTVELPAGAYTLQSVDGGTNIYFIEVLEK